LSSVRGIRGAITVEENNPKEVRYATRELLLKMVKANQVAKEDIAAVIFTTTPDLNAVFPAEAARELGWTNVPLLGAGEIDVAGGLSLCIRILMLVNTSKKQDQIKHIYLGDARKLRPDLSGG